MKTNEFRIGNYIYRVIDEKGTKTIGWIDTIYEEFAESEGWCQLEGIPCDKESLLKLGFIQNKSYAKYFHYELEGIHLRYRIGSGDVIIIYSGMEFSIPFEPKFIHELQNLIYMLTGHSIIFKP